MHTPIYEDQDGVRWVDAGGGQLVALQQGQGLLLAAATKWRGITRAEAEEQFGPLVEIMRPADTCTHAISDTGHCSWWACPNYVEACGLHSKKRAGSSCTRQKTQEHE